MEKQLTEGVYYQNIYPTSGCVVTDAGAVAVDGPSFPSDAIAWRAFIETKGGLRYHINSEHHADHIVANRFLGADTVVSGEYTNAHFLDSVKSDEGTVDFVRRLKEEEAGHMEGYKLRWPEIVFRDRLTLKVGGRTFHLIHSPGHTWGQTLVHAVEARVVFTGDNLTPGMHPFFHSASVWGWFHSLALMESLDVDWFVPGHGDPCGKEEIGVQRAKLHRVIGMVKALKDKGLGREEVQEQGGYIDDPSLDHPRVLGPRAQMLEKAGLGNIYDQLDAHPAL